jgi:hypothetical protein
MPRPSFPEDLFAEWVSSTRTAVAAGRAGSEEARVTHPITLTLYWSGNA